jgi:hypothetical protein
VKQLLPGEKFDRECLAFHEDRRYAATASHVRVKERPLSGTSKLHTQ